MAMPMMQIGIVRVTVPQWFVVVPVRMRLAHRPVVPMLMVLVMSVVMFMFERIMLVLVVVALSQVHPKSETHQDASENEPHR
jgi:hypothetical protein